MLTLYSFESKPGQPLFSRPKLEIWQLNLNIRILRLEISILPLAVFEVI